MTDTKEPTNSETGSSSRINPDPLNYSGFLAMEYENIQLIQEILENIAFKGTIQQIRALVNDPKWDDKPQPPPHDRH